MFLWRGIIVVMAVSKILFEPSLYLNGWDKGEHCPLDCCQASPVVSADKSLYHLKSFVCLRDTLSSTPLQHLSKLQPSVGTFLIVCHGKIWCALRKLDSDSPRSCVLSDVSLPTQSLWANVWSTLWMACTAPVGKSHTVWHFTAETVNGRVKQGQTNRKESLAAEHLFVTSQEVFFSLQTPQSEWCQWHYTFIIDLLHSVYEVASCCLSVLY